MVCVCARVCPSVCWERAREPDSRGWSCIQGNSEQTGASEPEVVKEKKPDWGNRHRGDEKKRKKWGPHRGPGPWAVSMVPAELGGGWCPPPRGLCSRWGLAPRAQPCPRRRGGFGTDVTRPAFAFPGIPSACKQVVSVETTRDIEWATYTCTLGFHVFGKVSAPFILFKRRMIDHQLIVLINKCILSQKTHRQQGL